MATKTFSGQLDQAIEGAASGNKLLFVPQENLGEVLMGAASEMVVGDDGTYSITLAYNTYSVYHYSDVTKCKILIADGVEVSASTSVSTIPDLIGVSVPVTDSDVLTNQGYLQEGQDYASSAKSSANASASLYNNFNKKIGQAIEPIETGVPMLDIPFNDSGILKKGVGTEYVSALPVHGVDFTRSTSCYYINKSGLIDYADVDEIAIGSDGAYLHDNVTGVIWDSFDISSASWGSDDLTFVDDGVLPPLSGDISGFTAYHMVNNSGEAYHRLYQTQTVSAGDCTVYTIVKPDSDFSNVRIESIVGDGSGNKTVVFNNSTKDFDLVANSPDDYGYFDLADGWVLVYMKYNDSVGTTARNYLYFLPTGSTDILFTGDGVNGGYVACFQKFNSNIDPRLLCVTSGASSTITATSCTVPVSGNLPAAGESFTVVCDSYVDDSSDEVNYGSYFTIGGTISYIGMSQSRAGALRVENSLGDWMAPNTSSAGKISRLTVTCEADSANEITTISVYQDGELLSSVDFSELFGDMNDNTIKLGASRTGVTSLNQQIKNFKILPYAASADEVKSWGAPK